jgi:HSP20 family protein
MAKNEKAKQIPVKKVRPEKEVAVAPSRLLSPLRAWEREMERMFEDFPFHWPRLRALEPFRFSRGLRLRVPALDLYEEKDDVVVKAEVPGLDKDDIEVTISDTSVTLKGEKRKEEETKEKDYYRSEREYGSFLRTIELPTEVQADRATALFKNGVLEIRVPKSDAAKKRSVQVKVE